jgi:hypothetical protein
MELSEREKKNLARADGLNAILSQSSIKEGSESAQLRSREQAAQRLQSRRQASDDATLGATLGARYGGGNFKGSGMMAQMLNIWNDPDIPRGDPRKEQAYAFLSAPETTSMGDGSTRVRPGILGGEETTNRKPTPIEVAATNAVSLSDANANVTPNAGSVEANWWDAAAAQIPFMDERFYQSQAWKNQQAAAEAWTETFAKSIKGGGQVTDDDRKQVRETYWPTESDDPAQISIKAQLRKNVEDRARTQARGASTGEGASIEDLLKIY